jgi:HpiC1 cyclase
MRPSRLLTLAAGCAVAAIVASVGRANANLISDGSFETPTVPVDSFTDFSTGATFGPGWTVFGTTGDNVAVVSGSLTISGTSYPAEDGVQWLDLTGTTNTLDEGVKQTVATTAGDRFQISYYIGNTTESGFGPTSTVGVLLNGSLTFTDENSAVSPTTLSYEQFTHDFVATSASTIIGFENLDPSTDSSNAIDNIVLTDLGPTAVPEPDALGLLAASLICFAAIRRWNA